MSLTGTLIILWESSFTSSTAVYLYDLLYYQRFSDELMIVAFSDDENYRIVWIRDFEKSEGKSQYQVNMNNGQAFSLVFWDSDYIWAVGRAVDSSSNEQAFHHLKLHRDYGDIDSALYK
jgi:hypothetical protein